MLHAPISRPSGWLGALGTMGVAFGPFPEMPQMTPVYVHGNPSRPPCISMQTPDDSPDCPISSQMISLNVHFHIRHHR
jgi:hypothetical protein